ncbi:MAG: IS4 family transposase [Chloroflexota bacterium]|nr:IS4 family transposase [Chloroflexota bacterium]
MENPAPDGGTRSRPADSTALAWAFGELRGAQLGDARLVQRLIQITLAVSKKPEASLPSACNGDPHEAKATYRFFDNDKVDPAEIMAAHCQTTLRRMQELDCKFVLGVQDSSYVNLTTHRATTGLGSIGAPGLRGFIHHGVLAVDAERGVPLGLLDSYTWVRPEDTAAPSAPQPAPPPADEDKESRRWLDALTRSAALLPADTRMLTVADREADAFEFFDHARNLGQHLLVRVHHDRNVAVDDEIQPLWDAALAAEPLGVITFTVPRDDKHNRPERQALATLHVAAVQLQSPRHLAARHLAPVPACVILLQEIDAPADQAPVQWLLLTTLAVQTLAEAHQCVIWYTWRWVIERLHFVLKSGCQYEKLQLETADRLWRALAIYLIVAWRVLYIDIVGRTFPTAPCTIFLTPDEWQALCCRHLRKPTPPPEPPDCHTAVRWLAKLGGFLGRKGDGEPGVKTLWRGLRRLEDITDMYQIMRRRD